MDYEIIEQKVFADGYIIRCHLPWQRTTPWATWRTRDPKNPDAREEGHYHRTEESSIKDFKERMW